MKKLFSALALGVLMASPALAQDESVYDNENLVLNRGEVRVTSDPATGKSVWVTVYGGHTVVYASGCIRPGQSITLKVNPSSGINYALRAEYKEAVDCGGGNVNDIWSQGFAHMSDYGIEGIVNANGIVSFH